MKTLYVLRHAKAERDAPSGEDYDRSLDARGRNDAARLGRMLKRSLAALGTNWPDLIVSSSSARTMQTVEQLVAEWPKSPEIRFDKKIYLAPASHLLDAVRAFPDAASSVVLVGHNPGMEELASQLANKVASDALRRMKSDFPTCALATFEISIDTWARTIPDLARLVAFSTPKDLADSADA